MEKFLSFSQDPLRPINLKDATKWAPTGDGRSFKLINPDMEKDRQFASAQIKVTAPYTPNEKLFIAGIANANIVDRVQERIDPRGLDLQNYLKNRQLLAHHSYYHPIGQVEELEVQDDGVYFRGWIGDPSKGELTEMQKEIRSLVSQGILRTVSVGFIPKKIRAPLFDDNGQLQEPTVIESWELLELSIVAIPCNQDSLFSIRDYTKGMHSAKLDTEQTSDVSLKDSLAELKNELAQQTMVVQTLVFNKSVFTKDQACKWATDQEFKADTVTEDDESYGLRQCDPSLFEENSFNTVEITKGVQAVIGKPIKKETAAAAPADQAPPADAGSSQSDNELLMLARGTNAACVKIAEMCDSMMKLMQQDSSEDQSEDATPPADAAPAKLFEKITSIEKTVSKLAEIVKVLAEKTIK